MLYFTELKNKLVATEDGIIVGRLSDVVFIFRDIPTVTKLIVKSEKLQHSYLFIPISYIISIGNVINLAKNYQIDKLHENEMFVTKNLLDKQIIDIEGKKVVRVNDVIFKQTAPSGLTIMGVDAGLLGILRWFGIENFAQKLMSMIGKKINASILPWAQMQPLELTEGKVRLNINQKKLDNLPPEDLADYLEATNMDNIIQTINLLDTTFAAEVVAELNLNYQTQFFRKVGNKKTIEIISLMDPDEAVDVLIEFSTKKREEVLARLGDKKSQELKELLSYSSTEVGEYITTEFISVDVDNTAAQVIGIVQKSTAEMSSLDYIYVTNKSAQVIGVFNLHELLVQQPANQVRKFMIEDPITVHLHTPLKSVQRKLIKYKLSALPVVDQFKKIIGIITLDDVSELFLKKI